MTEHLGAGPSLNENFDFSIDQTNDLSFSSGREELEKDLSFQMVINLSRYLGNPPSSNLRSKVAGTAKRVALADTRVTSVSDDSLQVQFSDNRREINISMSVRTNDEQVSLVFTV